MRECDFLFFIPPALLAGGWIKGIETGSIAHEMNLRISKRGDDVIAAVALLLRMRLLISIRILLLLPLALAAVRLDAAERINHLFLLSHIPHFHSGDWRWNGLSRLLLFLLPW